MVRKLTNHDLLRAHVTDYSMAVGVGLASIVLHCSVYLRNCTACFSEVYSYNLLRYAFWRSLSLTCSSSPKRSQEGMVRKWMNQDLLRAHVTDYSMAVR